MDCIQTFESQLGESERSLFRRLNSPGDIQEFLDELPYRPEDENYCPLAVFGDGKAHCFDGGLFAALCLRRLGYPARVVNMFPEPGSDDDHILAIYQIDGLFGAVAKSNFPGLRRREPVYRSLRELVMSYFDQYFNDSAMKTLRSYTSPLDLAAFDKDDWPSSNRAMPRILQNLTRRKRYPVMPAAALARLTPVDRRAFEMSMLHVDRNGLYHGPHEA